MRSHAKAPTAGSTQRQTGGLGGILGGAPVACTAPSDVGGSGAPSQVSVRGIAARTLLALALSALVSLTLVPVAGASKGTIFTFGAGGELGGQFQNPRGIAINETGSGGVAAGTLYVVDAGNRRIQAFDSDGNFQRAWGWDVVSAGPGDTGTGFEVCVAVDGDTCKTGTAGGGAGQFDSPTDVAVNQTTGDVYVAESTNRRVQAFDAEGNFLRTWGKNVDIGGGVADEICTVPVSCTAGEIGSGAGQFAMNGGLPGIDVDAAGDVYVADSGNQRFQKFSSTGEFLAMAGWDVIAGGATGFEVCTVAADCKAGVEGTGVGQFTEFGPGPLAVDPAGDVYAGDQNFPRRILHFTPALNPDSGFNPQTLGIGGPDAVAVNSADHHIFVPQGREAVIHELDPTNAETLEAHYPGAAEWQGIAINPVSDRLYVVRSSGSYVAVLEDVPSPTSALDPVEPVSGITPEGATFHGSINPNGVSTGYWFEYRADDSSTWTKLPATPVDVGSGASPVTVSQSVSGLVPPNTLFHLRLIASNSFGVIRVSPETTFTTLAIPAEVFHRGPSRRTPTTVQLEAYVNPHHALTTYWFEYGPDDCTTNPCSSAPTGQDASAGASASPIVVAQEIGGLQPGTTYHYCINTENAGGTTPCEDHTFTTRTLAEGLPQRGIEMVSNPDKGNQHARAIGPADDTPPMTSDGNRALWSVFAGAPGGNIGSGAVFLSERSSTGWRSQTVIPPGSQQIGDGDLKYVLRTATSDFSRFLFTVARTGLIPGALLGEASLVRIEPGQEQEVLAAPLESGELLADITDDGAHVVIVKEGQLVDVGSGAPEVLSLMPDQTPSSCGLHRNLSFIGWESNEVASLSWRTGYHRIATTDASRAYFQVKPDDECAAGLYGLYVRNRESAVTTLIDPGAAGVSPGAAGHSPELIRATPDGRNAYFTTFSQLDPSDQNANRDLYLWEEQSSGSSCLTCVVPDADLQDTAVLVSDDFSHAYFASESQLVPGKGSAGGGNLYVLSDGAIRFVANIGQFALTSSGVPGGAIEPPLSKDGNVLVFRSTEGRALTADAIAAQCPSVEPSAEGGLFPCKELYRYDDRDRSLECLSCRQGGETTHSFGSPLGLISASGGQFQMSADGDTVAFATAEALTPLDVNHDVDIYEWRNGARQLITDGLSNTPEGLGAPRVAAMDADGSDILFSVLAPGLTGFEQDGLAAVYDARVDGGFIPPSPAVHCTEDSCQGPLQNAPSSDRPASSSFSGRGNISSPPKRCGRGKVRRRGRCVSKRSLLRRACRKKSNRSKRRCSNRQPRRLSRHRQGGQVGSAKLHLDARRTK